MTTKEPTTRLGRGLASLLGEAVMPVANVTGIQSLAIELLAPGPFQPRRAMSPDSLDELADSVRTCGVLQPLLARPDPASPGRYQIIAGERRWRAAQKAGLHELPVLIRVLSDQDALAAALVENLQRQDLNAAEEAEGYRRLIDEFGLTQETLAQAVGKSRSHVANTLRLLNLPERVLTELRRGTISAGHARALLALVDPESALRVVLEKGLNVRQTEALTLNQDQADEFRPKAPRPDPDPDTRALENELSGKLGLRVEMVSRGRSGTVKIHYRTLEQLDAVIALLSH